MRLRVASRLHIALIAALLAIVFTSSRRVETKDAIPSDDTAIVHALSRLTFGATVREVDEVKRTGLSKWIERQLSPSTIDDSQMQARLSSFETLELSSDIIARDYERPARQERLQARRTQDGAGSRESGVGSPEAGVVSPEARVQSGEPMPNPDGTPDSRLPTPESRPRRMPTEATIKARLVLAELTEAKLLRTVYSERQLEEVLVDFWFNHFNVFASKGQTRVYITEYEREAIRPHVLGRFRDLLGATAKSPAMLFYLDNWMSSAPAGAQTLAPRPGVSSPRPGTATPMPSTQSASAAPKRMRGLNENYARELLELHTLGVDGGYTQADIVNVARAFTGWSIRLRASRPGGQVDQANDNGFRFVPFMHDAGAKAVLGHTIKASGGEQDGEQVLDIVAAHPSTARFIATKLARRFVHDQPPQVLIDRAAERFRVTKGDLREVVRTIITSPEFFAAEARGVKVKTPLEFVASALRITGAAVERATPLTRVLRDLGMPVYSCQPPTGYDDTAETWVSSGALVNRMNFAVDLTSGRLRGISMPAPSSDLTSVRDEAHRTLLFGRAGESTLSTMARATTPAQTLALAIGSPEFQRR